ncbi:NADPH:quinone oxidoreductase family protein [soil metagenome]
MKAISITEFGGPEVMTVDEIDQPKVMKDLVLVRVKAAGVNPVDTYIRSGTHAVRPKLPYTPGKDGAGVVEAVGEGVKAFKTGDRVYIADSLTGTYAEYALCREDQIGRLPENVSFEEGAGVFTPYATSYRALFQKANAKPGETVLIHGASGAVGIATVQWAKKAGLRVVGTASSKDGRDLARENGADHVFDHSSENHYNEIAEAVGEVDVVIEMLANENLQDDFQIVAEFGRMVVVGSRGDLTFTPRLTMTKDVTVLGMSLFNAGGAEMEEIKHAIFAGLADGSLKPHVRQAYPLAEAAEAHRQVIESKALGKIVLVP